MAPIDSGADGTSADSRLSEKHGRLSRRPRTTVVRSPLVSFEKEAANDGSRSDEQGLRLDEMIREIVRSEVRAEVARAMTTATAQPTHVSVAEYAAARSISVSTVRNAIRGGRLPAIRIGTAVRVPVDAEIGRPVIANANGCDAAPVTRAERILAERTTRSLAKADARRST